MWLTAGLWIAVHLVQMVLLLAKGMSRLRKKGIDPSRQLKSFGVEQVVQVCEEGAGGGRGEWC